MIERLVLKRTDVAGRGDEAPLDLSQARAYGKERAIRCPFHPDESPSLWVNLEKLCFHCFACEASGLLTPAGAGEMPSLPRVFRQTATTKPADSELCHERHRILSDALGYYQLQLLKAEPYLKARGVSMETASHWGCGACGYQQVQPFIDFMHTRGSTSLEALLAHGLLRKSSSGAIIASLRGRVVFPLTYDGLISNLAGRHLFRQSQDPKWLFLKNVQGLPKGVFAESNRHKNRVILTESIFDALPWLQRERPALALMGVHLPDWLVSRLEGKEVYFALNGDSAGELATQKQLNRLQGIAKEIRLIKLPSGYNDWNEYHCDRNQALGLVEAS